MKYVYELYEHGNRGIVFKGYKTVHSQHSEDAVAQASRGLEENIKLHQIYVSQEMDVDAICSANTCLD